MKTRHFTISLQFPHHGAEPVRVRCYETDAPGMYRVKVGEALAWKDPVPISSAMEKARGILAQVLGLPADPHADDPEPAFRPGQLVTMPGHMRRVEPGELDTEGGLETAIYKVLCPPMRCVDGWRTWIGKSPRYYTDPINARCRDLRPLGRIS